MGAAGQWLQVDTPCGTIRVYSVRPRSTPPWPGLLILHSAMGVDPHIQNVTNEFSQAGYWAVTPDLYTNDRDYKHHFLEHIELAAHLAKDELEQECQLSQHPPDDKAAILKARDWIGHRPTNTY